MMEVVSKVSANPRLKLLSETEPSPLVCLGMEWQ